MRVDSNVLHLHPGTAVEIGRVEGNAVVVDLRQGSLDADAPQLYPGQTFEIDTPNVSMNLAQAGHYSFDLDPQGNTRNIVVHDGLCRVVSASGENYTVQSGQSGAVTAAGQVQIPYDQPPAPVAPNPQYPQPPEPPQPPPDGNPYQQYAPQPQADPGADALNQYGNWSQTPYGMGWSPNVAQGWAPYTQGQWDYIAPAGWTWVDSEPWGFTPFHYGSWAFMNSAWFWIPGPAIYSPAMVGWVGGGPGLFGMVGWFPLGPREFNFRGGAYYPAAGIRYANLGFATVVRNDVFVGARPVFGARVPVSRDVLYRASVRSGAAIMPTRESIVGSRRALRYPSPYLTSRSVVAVTPHGTANAHARIAPGHFGMGVAPRPNPYPSLGRSGTQPGQQPRPGYQPTRPTYQPTRPTYQPARPTYQPTKPTNQQPKTQPKPAYKAPPPPPAKKSK